jgi:DNA-directed RNA polymerase subunit RPC12/RpoP
MTRMALNERDFFTEKPEMKPMALTCPKCGHREDYSLKWIRRTKKDRIPGGADERDRALFAKLKDYLVRADDFAMCNKCKRRFEIPSQHSLSMHEPLEGLPKDDYDQ